MKHIIGGLASASLSQRASLRQPAAILKITTRLLMKQRPLTERSRRQQGMKALEMLG